MGAIRLALALAVLLSHLPPAPFKFIGGGVAVQAFFVISGFYMSLVLSGKYQDHRLFYSNRLARLAPNYAVMLVLGSIMLFGLDASATSSRDIFSTISNPLTLAVAGIENLVVVGQDLLYWFRLGPDGALIFDATGITPGPDSTVAWQLLLVPQSWSLSLELLFYAMAPWACRQPTGRLIMIALASIALRFAGYLLPVDFFLPGRDVSFPRSHSCSCSASLLSAPCRLRRAIQGQ